MSEQTEWPGNPDEWSGVRVVVAETKCGVWNTVVVILALSIVIGLLVGLLIWKFWG